MRKLQDDLTVVRDAWVIAGFGITAGKGVMFAYGKYKGYTDGATTTMTAIDLGLTGLNFFVPLKTPVTVLQRAVKAGNNPIRRIDDKLDRLDGIAFKTTPKKQKDFDWIDQMNAALDDAALVHAVIRDYFTSVIFLLDKANEANENQQEALNAAVRYSRAAENNDDDNDDNDGASDYAVLKRLLDKQSEPRVDAIDDVRPDVKAVRRKVDDLNDIFEEIDFSAITTQMAGLDRIADLLDALKVPLDIAASALEPIKPLLDAIGLLSELVDSAVDFVVETLGLGDLLDDAEDAIASLLPSGKLFDKLLEFVETLYDTLQELIDETLGAADMLEQVEKAAFGNGMGDALKGVTGWSDDEDNELRGDSGRDILDALGGDDTIRAGGGDDVIVAGEGSDKIYGEGGEDFIYFDASFTEYELARDDDGDIIVSHVKPRGLYNTGVDILKSLDNKDVVAFTDISFTGRELNDAIIGGSVLEGTSKADLMFLNSTGKKVDGFYVAEGYGGDDRIFGSTEDDRLRGGKGDDVLLPGKGDDEAIGGSGTDTFQVLAGSGRALRIDLEEETAFGEGTDRLVNIENVVVMPGQKHFVRGTNEDNTIFTASGIDVVTGRGGDDTISTGGEDDYIVAGAGADNVNAGSGRNVMVSGSAAVDGVRDVYVGGVDYDVVAYTSSSNLIKSDINDQSDDPSILQKLKDYMGEIADSGRVEIDGTTGRIARFDKRGKQVTTDRTEGVEGFVGSDKDDLLVGGRLATFLHGAGGDDVIRTNGTASVNGGAGDDLIRAQRVDGGATRLQVEGGAGRDRLELDDVGEARWFYKVESAISLQLRALDIATEGDDLRNANAATFSLKPSGIEELVLGDYSDHAIFEPGGSQTITFRLGDGDDRFDGENGFADVRAGRGDDVGNFFSGGGGSFQGGMGDDISIWSDTSAENEALMGEGTDSVEIRRFKGHADGGGGFDTISFEIKFQSRIEADLSAGTVRSFKGASVNNAEQVDMTLEGFEQVVATDYDDDVAGSNKGERIVGRDGRDDLSGGRGSDELYGGSGNDSLRGGADDDVLHGGGGSDSLDGGSGRDTASYAWTQPDGVDGAMTATSFGGVVVDLVAGTATGGFGTDTLEGIENVTGGGGRDTLTGNQGANFLSGGGGSDKLKGGAGNDVIVAGAGNDDVSGGFGDDRIVVGRGKEVANGGQGYDILDFGLIGGSVTIDIAAGTYTARIEKELPRWANRSKNEDGFESRNIDGVRMTPEDVFEADPLRADDATDLARDLPEEGDDDFADAQIEIVTRRVDASGTFRNIEAFEGARSEDRIEGGEENDALDGGSGRDTLKGGKGRDTLEGGGSSDKITGGNGSDRAFGGAGRDELYGDRGDDELTGNEGADLLVGGSGADDFNFVKRTDSTKDAMDVIDGFDGAGRSGGDRIDVSDIDAVKGKSGNQKFDFGKKKAKGDLWAENDGRDTMIYGNIDDDKFAEIQIRIEDGRDTSATDYSSGDFIL